MAERCDIAALLRESAAPVERRGRSQGVVRAHASLWHPVVSASCGSSQRINLPYRLHIAEACTRRTAGRTCGCEVHVGRACMLSETAFSNHLHALLKSGGKPQGSCSTFSG